MVTVVVVVVMVVLLVVIGNPLGKAHQLWHGRTLSFKRQEKNQASNENHPSFSLLSPLSRTSCHVEPAVLAFAPVKVALRSHWARTYIGTTILPAGFLRQVRVAPL